MKNRGHENPGKTFSLLGLLMLSMIGVSALLRRESSHPPPPPSTKKSETGMKFSLRLLIEVATVILLGVTAKIQYDSFIVQKGRPFLTVSFDEIRPPASGEKVGGLESVEWVYSIKNSGPIPAFQTRSYGLAMISGRPVVSLNLSSLAPTDKIDRILPKNVADAVDGIVPPGVSVSRTFVMPRIVYQTLLESANKMEDGMAIRVEYASPWEKEGSRPYFHQSRMIPWLDGNNRRFKINASKGN